MANLSLGPNDDYRSDLEFASNRTGIDAAALAALIDAEAAKGAGGKWDAKSKAKTTSASGLTQFLDRTWLDMARKEGTYLNEIAKAQGLVTSDNTIVDQTKDALLDLRFEPRQAIVAAAEYGTSNLSVLKSNSVEIPKSDDEKTKLMYLAHHEGSTGALSILQGTMSEERATDLLPKQVGKKQADSLIEKHGNAVDAYKAWIEDYIDRKIQPAKFRKP